MTLFDTFRFHGLNQVTIQIIPYQKSFSNQTFYSRIKWSSFKFHDSVIV